MFKGKSIWQIIQLGGFAMYVLLFCSVLSLAVIAERVLYYRRMSRVSREDFMSDIRKELEEHHPQKVLDQCRKAGTPFSKVAEAGLNLRGRPEKIIMKAMEREITFQTIRLERFTSILATIGSTALYIGLFGTVMGIIRAFNDISASGVSGVNMVLGGIPEALICTAAGLLVAIPAVVSYNFFIRQIDKFVADMELCASEIVDLLSEKK